MACGKQSLDDWSVALSAYRTGAVSAGKMCIRDSSRETTLENTLAAMPYMDEDMRQLAAAAVNKLQAMTDSEFSERDFILTDEE